MKIKILLTVVSTLFILNSVFGQGALTPPGVPMPTMRTLDQIEPRTPISLSSFTISQPGSYYLTTNLNGGVGRNGVTITSGNVTLDLNGFSILGLAGSLEGVVVSVACTNITVRNGSISGWGSYGVDIFAAVGSLVEHLTVSKCGDAGILAGTGLIQDCVVLGNPSVGISCGNGQVLRCKAQQNGSTGIDCSSGQVRDCVAYLNGGDGIHCQIGEVRNCESLQNSGIGIYVSPGTVSDCVAQNNLQSGIYLDAPAGQAVGNTCIGNNAYSTTNQAGIFVNDNRNRIEGNHVSNSGYAGIKVNNSQHDNLIIKNSVMNSGTFNYVFNTNQIAGPIITSLASGVITNNSPWANFSF